VLPSFKKAVHTPRLELDFLAHPTQDPADARRHLDHVSLSIANLVSQTARVRQYQFALQQDPLDASDLKSLVKKLARLRQLWCAAEGWRYQTTLWMEVRASPVRECFLFSGSFLPQLRHDATISIQIHLREHYQPLAQYFRRVSVN
jgi:hypothetical protein